MDHNTRGARRSGASPGAIRRVTRRRLGVLAGVAGLAVLAAGCGQATGRMALNAQDFKASGSGSGITTSWPASSGLVTPAAHPPKNKINPPSSGATGGALFGGTSTLLPEEHKLGRTLAIVRVYYLIGQDFHNPAILKAGSTLLVSLDSKHYSYASIAAGREDHSILSFMKAVNAAAYQYHLNAIYFTFEHEPLSPEHIGLGTGAQFIRAWDHVHALAASAHLDWNDGGRMHWVLIMIHNQYSAGEGIASYWPGSNEVDIVAADGYNSYACRMRRTHQPVTTKGQAGVNPSWAFDPVLSFARSHGGIPVFVAEWGSDTAPAGIQATFIREMSSFVASHTQIAAAMYWDNDGISANGVSCDYAVNNNPASLAALAAMGRSSALQGTAHVK